MIKYEYQISIKISRPQVSGEPRLRGPAGEVLPALLPHRGGGGAEVQPPLVPGRLPRLQHPPPRHDLNLGTPHRHPSLEIKCPMLENVKFDLI